MGEGSKCCSGGDRVMNVMWDRLGHITTGRSLRATGGRALEWNLSPAASTDLISARLVDISHELEQIRRELLLILAARARAHKAIAVLKGLPPCIQRAAMN